MKDVVDKCSTKGCAIDVGTIIDNEDCVYRVEKLFPTREEAESAVAAIRERAVAAASETPTVDYTIEPVGNEAKRRNQKGIPIGIPFLSSPIGGRSYSKRHATFIPMPKLRPGAGS